ncbi:hypothetical protein [Nonomuraea candida]|uniref:hypothetical protein n=1 Tax=Nonomuraea candida TaxID=359159 RepID=UPI0005BB10B4|nr:hypothetical protein [Nonomuraea candida]
MDEHGVQVPFALLIAAVEEQRDTALTQAAQMRALARHLQAENERLTAELEKLRADTSVS